MVRQPVKLAAALTEEQQAYRDERAALRRARQAVNPPGGPQRVLSRAARRRRQAERAGLGPMGRRLEAEREGEGLGDMPPKTASGAAFSAFADELTKIAREGRVMSTLKRLLGAPAEKKVAPTIAGRLREVKAAQAARPQPSKAFLEAARRQRA